MNATFASVRPVHVSDTDALAALYIARMLHKQIIPIRVFNDSLYTEEIRALVGISPSEGNIPKAKALQLLKVQLPQLNTMTGKRTPRLQRNIHMLGRLLSLTDIEEAIRKRSSRGVLATPRALRYPNAAVPFRSAAPTAGA